MTYVDAAILHVLERLCRRFQLLTGRTNIWLAFQLTNLSIVIYFVWAGFYFLRIGGAARVMLILFCAGLLYLLSQTIFRVPLDAYEASAYQRVAKGLRNPRQVRDLLLRIPFLTLSVVLVYPTWVVYTTLGLHLIALTYSLILLTTVVLYLLACDPLPPCPGTIREWVRGLLPARAERSGSAVTTKLAKRSPSSSTLPVDSRQ
jgi:hypothetical protein